jgi:ribose 1,5-bisphosphokinase
MSMPRPNAPLVYVMGASGAGKDTLIAYAHAGLGGRVAIAPRYVTRPSSADAPTDIAVTGEEFEARRMAGAFAMAWHAHGVSYAIGIETEAWRAAGTPVLANGSRAHFETHLREKPGIVPVLVTAPLAVIEARLAARGREAGAAIRDRIARAGAHEMALDIAQRSLTVIENAGRPQDAGERLLALLNRLAAESARGM